MTTRTACAPTYRRCYRPSYLMEGGAGAVLDAFLAQLQGAYSLRLVVSAYSGGPLIRVRRSSDNAEQDVGHTSTGALNTASMASFVGANSAFVVTWYDQSGNGRHLTQATGANQARIVNAGTNDPGLFFTGAEFYDAPAGLYGAIDSPANYGAAFWMNRTDGLADRDPIGFRSAARLALYCPADDVANTFTARSVNDAGTEFSTPAITYTPNAWRVYGHTLNRTTLETIAYYDTQTQTVTGSGTFADALTSGRVGFAPLGGGLDGHLAELVVYSTHAISGVVDAIRNAGAPTL